MNNKLTIFIMLVAFLFLGVITQAQTIDVQRPASTSITEDGTDATGNQVTGTEFTLTYTIEEMSGLTDLTVTNITASNTSNVTLGTISPTAVIVTAGTTTTFDVPVTVDVAAGFSFDLTIVSDAGDLSFDFSVTGTGIPGEIDIQGNDGNSVAHLGADDVGNQMVNTEFTLNYTIEETSGSDLEVSDFVISDWVNCTTGTVTYSDGSFPGSSVFLNSNGTTTLTADIPVTVTNVGDFSFSITVTSDDTDEGVYTIDVEGVGATDVSIQPVIYWGFAADGIIVSTDPAYTTADTPEAWEVELEFGNTDDDSTGYDMSAYSTVLLNNTTYYWWTKDDGLGTWTLGGSFTTADNVTPFLTAPVSGLQLNSTTVELYWNTSGHVGDYRYDVFYGTTPVASYAGETPDLNNLDNQIAFVNGLTPGLTYYWQVRVKTPEGAILGYSVVESFVTYGVLTAPMLLYPQDEGETYTTDPYVYWTSYFYNTVVKYKVNYSTSSDVTSVAGGDSLSTSNTTTALSYDLYAQLEDLNSGTPYYWQVGATNDDGVTYVWSDIWSFETPGTAGSGSLFPPTPTYPTGGLTVYSSSVTFYWQAVSTNGSMQYQLQYATDNGFTTDVVTLMPTSNSFAQVANLVGDEAYYWHVRSYDGTDFGDWSVTENFNTDVAVLQVETPQLLTPYDNSFVTTLTPTFYWYVSGNPNGYTFTPFISTSGNQGTDGNLDPADTLNIIYASPNTTDGYYAKYDNAVALVDGDTYYWQIVATKGASDPVYSAIRTFTINLEEVASAAPEIPIPTYPTGGLVVLTADPVLNWAVNAQYTDLEFEALYATSDATTDGVLDGGISTGWTTNLATNLSGLTPGAIYYWQVRSQNASTHSNTSDYSSVQYFVVSGGAAPVMAILGSPVAGAVIADIEPTLSWILPTQSTSQLNYEVEIADNKAMNAAQRIEDLTSNNVKVTLPAGKKYYWRVRSKTDNGDYSYYTGSGEFEIDQSITDVEPESELPTEFRVSQNYPNPFNPSTTIKFALPASEKVSVKIYDMLGREVATLLNTQLEAGNHQVVWNGQNNYGSIVSTGVYFYRVVSGNNIVVKKMLLMK